MKKWTKLLAVPATLAVLAACGDGGTQDTTEEPATEEPAEDTTMEEDTATQDDTAMEEDTAEEGEDTDATSGASQVTDAEELQTAFEEGPFIVLLQNDVEAEEELTLAGGIENNDGEIQRRVYLHTVDENDEVTDTFTLSAPSITVESENSSFVDGTVESDITVEEDGFSLEEDITIEGTIDFASQENYDSANLEDAEITGNVTVEGEPVE